MTAVCEWCNGKGVYEERESVYWELPDGTRAIEISDTPTLICDDCGMVYLADSTVKEIEDQLFLVDTKGLARKISYNNLMALPRVLKRNYFDFS